MALCVGIVCLAANSSGNRPSEVGRVPPRARSGVQSDIRISITVCCRLCLDGGALATSRVACAGVREIFSDFFMIFSEYFSDFFRIYFCPTFLLCVLFRCRYRFCGRNPFAVALPRGRTRAAKKRRCVPGRMCSSYMLLTRTSRIRANTRWVPGLLFLFWSVLVAPLSPSGAGEPVGETPETGGPREGPTPTGLFASACRSPAGVYFLSVAVVCLLCGFPSVYRNLWRPVPMTVSLHPDHFVAYWSTARSVDSRGARALGSIPSLSSFSCWGVKLSVPSCSAAGAGSVQGTPSLLPRPGARGPGTGGMRRVG